MLAPGRIASRAGVTEGAAVGPQRVLADNPTSITSDNICHIKSLGVGSEEKPWSLEQVVEMTKAFMRQKAGI